MSALRPLPGGAPDDGRADARLVAALAAHDGSAPRRAETLAALVGARVFSALRATSTREHVAAGTGLRAESSAEMAMLGLRGSSGGLAVPLFPDGHDVQRWQAGARPVPLQGPQACAAALDQGAVAVLLDPLGAAVVLDAVELGSLARGWVPVPGSALAARSTVTALRAPRGPVDPALLEALGAALEPEPVAAARVLEGPEGQVLGLVLRATLDAAGLAALAGRLVGRLGAALPATGLDVTVVQADGPGVPVPLPGSSRVRGRWGLSRGR